MFISVTLTWFPLHFILILQQVLFILSTNNLLQEQSEEQTSSGLETGGATPGLGRHIGLILLDHGGGIRLSSGLLHKSGERLCSSGLHKNREIILTGAGSGSLALGVRNLNTLMKILSEKK